MTTATRTPKGNYPKKARWARFLLEPVEERLAAAMLDAKAGASGDFDSAEQKRRTILMAEWIIARLPFYDLALIEKVDELSDEEREQEYRRWLHEGPAS
jgi:hypothetical protein